MCTAAELDYYDPPDAGPPGERAQVLGWVLHCHVCLECAHVPLYRGCAYQRATDPIEAFANSHLEPHLAYADVVLNGQLRRLPITEREV